MFISFFFYSSKAGRCCDSILHFKPTSYGGLRHFKSGIYLGCALLGVESTSEIKTLTYCCVARILTEVQSGK